MFSIQTKWSVIVESYQDNRARINISDNEIIMKIKLLKKILKENVSKGKALGLIPSTIKQNSQISYL